MKKSIILIVAIVLCAFVVASCKQEPSHKLQGNFYQSYPDTEGKGPYYQIEFSGQRTFRYDAKGKLIEKGDFTIERDRVKILWDDGSRSSFTVSWPFSGDGVIKIDGYTYDRR